MQDPSAATTWAHLVQDLTREVDLLPPAERDWILSRLARIGALQSELHATFLALGGAEACSACRGECCDRGRHHPTLVNALGYLLAGEALPQPDFDRPCPYLGAQQCQFDVPRRPFNCITFVCGTLDERLEPAERQAVAGSERELRRLYGEFDRRYAGGGLQGLLLRSQTLAGGPLLALRPQPTTP